MGLSPGSFILVSMDPAPTPNPPRRLTAHLPVSVRRWVRLARRDWLSSRNPQAKPEAAHATTPLSVPVPGHHCGIPVGLRRHGDGHDAARCARSGSDSRTPSRYWMGAVNEASGDCQAEAAREASLVPRMDLPVSRSVTTFTTGRAITVDTLRNPLSDACPVVQSRAFPIAEPNPAPGICIGGFMATPPEVPTVALEPAWQRDDVHPAGVFRQSPGAQLVKRLCRLIPTEPGPLGRAFRPVRRAAQRCLLIETLAAKWMEPVEHDVTAAAGIMGEYDGWGPTPTPSLSGSPSPSSRSCS